MIYCVLPLLLIRLFPWLIVFRQCLWLIVFRQLFMTYLIQTIVYDLSYSDNCLWLIVFRQLFTLCQSFAHKIKNIQNIFRLFSHYLTIRYTFDIDRCVLEACNNKLVCDNPDKLSSQLYFFLYIHLKFFWNK